MLKRQVCEFNCKECVKANNPLTGEAVCGAKEILGENGKNRNITFGEISVPAFEGAVFRFSDEESEEYRLGFNGTIPVVIEKHSREALSVIDCIMLSSAGVELSIMEKLV